MKLKMLKNGLIKLLVLFLLLSQFLTLAHAIDHQLAQDENEQCLICLHDVNSKNILVETTNTISLDFGTYEKTSYTPYTFYLATPSYHNIRSPPSSLT